MTSTTHTVHRVFTSRQARDICGFKTTYMLDYLHRTEIVVASFAANPGRGRRRLYLYEDLIVLKVVNRLLEEGLPVRRLRRAFQKLRLDPKLNDSSASVQYLTTDGKDVYLSKEDSLVINLSAGGQMAFAFVLDFAGIRKAVEEASRGKGTELESRVA